jgi:hypothetical protein
LVVPDELPDEDPVDLALRLGRLGTLVRVLVVLGLGKSSPRERWSGLAVTSIESPVSVQDLADALRATGLLERFSGAA